MQPKEPHASAEYIVGVTGLEPATAWSQTRNATNCATPRLQIKGDTLNCGAKLSVFLGLCKKFHIFLLNLQLDSRCDARNAKYARRGLTFYDIYPLEYYEK